MDGSRKTLSERSLRPRKRLLSDCAKPKAATSSGECSLKKTRELPNLTECHACGYRTDMGSSENHIQTLYSEWRIVLLCPECYHRVDSSQICSYCFKEASREECFSCSQCKRSLHTTCLLDYKSVPPWSYASDFTLCIDCWVPKHIVCKRRNPNSIPRVEPMEKKAPVSKQAIELDDAEFAFRMHRTINTLPRISKNTKLIAAGSTRALSCLKPTKIVYARRKKIEPTELVTKKPVHIVYARRRNKVCELLDSQRRNKYNDMVYARRRNKGCELLDSQCRNKYNDMVYVRRGKKPSKLVYKRRRRKQSESAGVETVSKERCANLLSNMSVVDTSMNSESKPSSYQDGSIVFDNMQSDGKLVQYLLTYSRKKSNWKGTTVSKTNFLYGEYNLETQASSSQLPESLIISTNTFQCSAFPHQATAESDSSQDPPVDWKV